MIRAKVTAITSKQSVSFLEFDAKNLKLFMLGLSDFSELKVGDEVILGFKSSDVIIASKPLQNCSLANEIKAKISDINIGEIISVIELKRDNFCFESMITTASLKRLNLKKTDEIYAYIKATSLHISEILC